MAPQDLDHVVVIGGSLAGLFTANVLKSIPSIRRITILERFQENQLQDLGAGIRTGAESIQAILKYTGTPPEKYALETTHYRFVNREGDITADQPGSSWVSTWYQLYRVLRASFDSDPPRCTYRHGCTLDNLIEHETNSSTGEVQVTFTNEDGKQEKINANLVIGADGASSRTRTILVPNVDRAPVGYACVRGVVYEDELTPTSAALFRSSATFFWTESGQLVSYAVPSSEGSADESRAWVNWVWYEHKTADEMVELLTDASGRRHKFTLPAGGMSDAAIDAIRKVAVKVMPPAHAEIIGKTSQPFVQIVTDSMAPQTAFWGGKVLLIGDAVGGQRPHTASALLQCAFHAVVTGKLVRNELDLETWARETQAYSHILVSKGKELGDICMSTMPPPERTPVFFGAFFGTQAQLKAKWDEIIGDLNV